MMDVKQLNVNNLTSLWKEVGMAYESYYNTIGWAYCSIPKSNWPNRFWNLQKGDEELTRAIKEKILQNGTPKNYTYFDIYDGDEVKQIFQNGFNKLSHQYGMHLQLLEGYTVNMSLSYRKIKKLEDALIWSELFESCFGYYILPTSILKIKERVDFYIVLNEGENVGTLLLYKTQSIMGIHALGVIPKMRGRGYAKEIMDFALNTAIKDRARYATLQASEMAKSMYEKLGFEYGFMMYNFKYSAKF